MKNPCKILRKRVKLSDWKDWTKMDCEGSKMMLKVLVLVNNEHLRGEQVVLHM